MAKDTKNMTTIQNDPNTAVFAPGARPARLPLAAPALPGAPGDLPPPGPIPGAPGFAAAMPSNAELQATRAPSIRNGAPALAVVGDSPEAVADAVARARALRGKKIEFKLEVPIIIANKVYETLYLRRPTWPEFEKALANPNVQSKKITENVAMMAVVCGVQPAVLADPNDGLDLFDGMRLMEAVQDFFPAALRAKPLPTSASSSETSPNDGDGAPAISTE
jgi:hypothetical protein